MFWKLLSLFTIVPFVELAILIKLGEVIGLWPTLAIVIITGAAGAALARREGLIVVRKLREELSQGMLPGKQLVNGLLVLIGGILLMTPGILTDITGFLLIFPLTRKLFRERIIRWLQKKMAEGNFQIRSF